MRASLLLAAALLAPLAATSQDRWIRLAETDNSTWEVKPGSLELSKTKGQVDIAVVIGRVNNSTTKQITVGKWYVSLADCDREMGKLVALDLDGKYRYENEFVFGAGSVAAAISESICLARSQQVKASEDKGI